MWSLETYVISGSESWKQNVHHHYLLERLPWKRYTWRIHFREVDLIDTIFGNKEIKQILYYSFLLEKMNVLRPFLETNQILRFVSKFINVFVEWACTYCPFLNKMNKLAIKLFNSVTLLWKLYNLNYRCDELENYFHYIL